jgi:serine phosphatase RsbU (regulator of sigma subunit)
MRQLTSHLYPAIAVTPRHHHLWDPKGGQQIGGDLYAATRIIGGVHIMIGDVRGKGLFAIGEAALLLGAFREAAHRHICLPDLVASLEQSVTRYLADFEPAEETGERFATTLLLELPDDDHITRIVSCGHPRPGSVSPAANSDLSRTATSPSRSGLGPLTLHACAGHRWSTSASAWRRPFRQPATSLPFQSTA